MIKHLKLRLINYRDISRPLSTQEHNFRKTLEFYEKNNLYFVNYCRIITLFCNLTVHNNKKKHYLLS